MRSSFFSVREKVSSSSAERYDVANLEDAYLALVGRRELSRSHVEADVVA